MKTSKTNKASNNTNGANIEKQLDELKKETMQALSSEGVTILADEKIEVICKNACPLADEFFKAYEAEVIETVSSIENLINSTDSGIEGYRIRLEKIDSHLTALSADIDNLKDKAEQKSAYEKAVKDYEESKEFRANFYEKSKSELNTALSLANKALRNKFYKIFDNFNAVQIMNIFCGAYYSEGDSPEKTRKNALNALHYSQISAVPDTNFNCEVDTHEAPATINGLRLYREEIARHDAESKGEKLTKDKKAEIVNSLIPSTASEFLQLYKIASARLFSYDNKSDLTNSAVNAIEKFNVIDIDDNGKIKTDDSGEAVKVAIFDKTSRTASEKQIKILAMSLLLDAHDFEIALHAMQNNKTQVIKPKALEDFEKTYHFKRNNGYALYFEAYKKIRGAFTIVDNISLIDAFIIEARYARKGLYTPVIDTAGILKATKPESTEKKA